MMMIKFAIAAVAFSAGVFVGYMDRTCGRQTITETAFGWADTANDYPHCQTDMTFSDQWTPRLMYLNGIWTAACAAQSESENQ